MLSTVTSLCFSTLTFASREVSQPIPLPEAHPGLGNSFIFGSFVFALLGFRLQALMQMIYIYIYTCLMIMGLRKRCHTCNFPKSP